MGRKLSSTNGHSSIDLSTFTKLKNGYETESIVFSNTGSQDRIIFLSGDVNEHSISNTISHLIMLANHNSSMPIYLIISTYGGSIDEMFSLYDTIKFLSCPVYTVALGKVMSAGVLLLSAGTKGKRLIGKNARIMMHPVSSEIAGNIFQIINDAQETLRLQKLMSSCLVKETSMTEEQLDQIMKVGHDHYITPEDAIKLGIVDTIIGDK